MSDLTAVERIKLERVLKMGEGFVLNFCNRTFAEFVLLSTGIDIYDPKYGTAGNSKANRLRTFWTVESNYVVGKLLGDIVDGWEEVGGGDVFPEECKRIIGRIKESAPVPDIGVLSPASDEKVFEALAKSIRDSIERNEPQNGLDRLHTYVVKYLRARLRDRGISAERDRPLHSLAGEYIKALRNEGKIESEMAERILKSSISILEAFNDVRSNKSFAHDNPMLKHGESILIHSYITSLIRFIQGIESGSSHDQTAGNESEPDEF